MATKVVSPRRKESKILWKQPVEKMKFQLQMYEENWESKNDLKNQSDLSIFHKLEIS